MAKDVFNVVRPASVDRQKTIIVLGAPRGGTSMVSASLRLLGVMMGHDLGHQHEDPQFRKDVPIKEKIATVAERNNEHDIWGWKLPGSVYYLRELMPHVRNPHFVVIFRNAFSIARSSIERGGADEAEMLKHLKIAMGATRHVADIVNEFEVPVSMSAFESVIRSRAEFVRGLAGFVGIEATPKLVKHVVTEGIGKELGYRKLEV